MITIHFPPHLRRFVNVPETCQVPGTTIREVLDDLETRYPGIRGYLLHENGTLRQHVNLFLDQRLVQDRENLDQSLAEVAEMTVMQALSGG
jgi:molybdopterin converting factor small subunit